MEVHLEKSSNYVVINVYSLMMVLSSLLVGSLYYGELTLTEVNFFKYNFIYKWSELYGVNSYFFYFGISLPLILGPCYVLLLVSSFMMWTQLK